MAESLLPLAVAAPLETAAKRSWTRRSAFHLAEEVEERMAEGLPPERALAAARRDFGNVTRLRELTRETWGWGPAERLLQDFRHAIRGLHGHRGYTCAVVLTLALGIGLNAAMFGLLSQLFLRAPPHIEDAAGIHRVWVRERDLRTDSLAPTGALIATDRMDWAEFGRLRADPARFASVGGYTAPRPIRHGRGQNADELRVSWATGNLFALLGARPALGRSHHARRRRSCSSAGGDNRPRLLEAPLCWARDRPSARPSVSMTSRTRSSA